MTKQVPVIESIAQNMRITQKGIYFTGFLLIIFLTSWVPMARATLDAPEHITAEEACKNDFIIDIRNSIFKIPNSHSVNYTGDWYGTLTNTRLLIELNNTDSDMVITSGTTSAPYNIPRNANYIGSNGFKGKIYSVEAWNYALSENEIYQVMYNSHYDTVEDNVQLTAAGLMSSLMSMNIPAIMTNDLRLEYYMQTEVNMYTGDVIGDVMNDESEPNYYDHLGDPLYPEWGTYWGTYITRLHGSSDTMTTLQAWTEVVNNREYGVDYYYVKEKTFEPNETPPPPNPYFKYTIRKISKTDGGNVDDTLMHPFGQVLLSTDILPSQIWNDTSAPLGTSLTEHYLEQGGKMVWPSGYPAFSIHAKRGENPDVDTINEYKNYGLTEIGSNTVKIEGYMYILDLPPFMIDNLLLNEVEIHDSYYVEDLKVYIEADVPQGYAVSVAVIYDKDTGDLVATSEI